MTSALALHICDLGPFAAVAAFALSKTIRVLINYLNSDNLG